MQTRKTDASLLGKRIKAFDTWYVYLLSIFWVVFSLGMWILVAPLFPIILFFGLWGIWTILPYTIVYENGIWYKFWLQPIICYWHQISQIIDITDDYENPIRLTIVQPNGTRFTIGRSNIKASDSFQWIIDEFNARHFDYQLSQIRQGKSAKFGSIELYEREIVVGDKRYLLSDIKAIKLAKYGQVMVQTRDDNGQSKLLSFSKSAIPNRHLFKQLFLTLTEPLNSDNAETTPEVNAAVEQQATVFLPSVTYRTGALSRRVAVLGLGSGVISLLLILLVGSNFTIYSLHVLSVLIGTMGILNYLLRGRSIVTLDGNGITITSPSKKRSMQWQDIVEVKDYVDFSDKVLLPSYSISPDLTLVDIHGNVLFLPSDVIHHQTLVTQIHNIYEAMHLPSAIQSLDDGQSLDFGVCHLDLEALRLENNVFALENISQIKLGENGTLDIFIDTQHESRRLNTKKAIPNRRLLVAIIAHIKIRAESRVIFNEDLDSDGLNLAVDEVESLDVGLQEEKTADTQYQHRQNA